jgi:hypothetical protein
MGPFAFGNLSSTRFNRLRLHPDTHTYAVGFGITKSVSLPVSKSFTYSFGGAKSVALSNSFRGSKSVAIADSCFRSSNWQDQFNSHASSDTAGEAL